MCQPKSAGGRRCVAHHPSTLSMKFIAKHGTRLEDGQINYLFNALRHKHSNLEAPSAEEYKNFLQEQKEAILADSDLATTVKTRMVKKLDKAIDFDQIPDGRAYYALRHLDHEAKNSWRNLAINLRQIANDQNKTPSAIFRQFRKDYDKSVASRGPVDYDNRFDAKTQKILDKLAAETPDPVFEETPRITRTATQSITLPAYGYDPEDGRLEVEHVSGSVYAYHSVDEETFERFQKAPTAVLPVIANNPRFTYENTKEAEQDAYRVWCEGCSEFKLASGHVCQNRGVAHAHVRNLNLDEIYNRTVRGDRRGLEITPVDTPTWHNTDDLEEVTPSSDLVEYPRGTHRRGGSTNSKRIQPNPDEIRRLMADGKKVKVNLGRRVAKSGTDGAEFHEVTVPATFNFKNGNMQVEQNIDYSQAKCTCEQYQVNGRCKHIYPNEESDAMNEFVKKDILKSAMHIRGYNQRHPAWRNRGTAMASFASDVDENGKFVMTSEMLNDMRFATMHADQQSSFNLYQKGETENGNLEYVPLGALHVDEETGNVSARSSTYGDAAQTQILNKAAEELKEELRNSNFVAVRAQRNAERVLNGWEVNSESRDPYLRRFSSRAENGYLANPETFLRDYREVMNDRSDFEYVRGAVTDGYLSTGPGRGARGFGVEIEFVGANQDDVAELLHSVGLSEYNRSYGYHSANDYSSWRVEDDCSVSGEVVSPILYDNEESWDQLAKVCEAVKSLGATTSRDAGAHVHIGAQGLNMRQQLGVVAAATAHQDVIRRITTDPNRGTHRTSDGNSYTRAFEDSDIENIYQQVNSAHSRRSLYFDRYNIISPNERGGTLEFRDPDGSLDPSHMQSQVILASSLVSAGESGDWNDLTYNRHQTQRIGFNAQRENLIGNDVDEDSRILASNISLMTTLDSLFSNEGTRKRMLRAALRNSWQAGRPDRRRRY